jgi:uncharacterized protein YecT (DUF1311 family)
MKMRLAVAILAVMSARAQDDETKCCCTTADTNICLVKVEKAVDSKLKETYQAALKKLRDSEAGASKLRDTQRKWLAYRDAACKAESDLYEEGSIAPQIFGFCIVKLTKRRIADIQDAYLGNRWDSLCPELPAA